MAILAVHEDWIGQRIDHGIVNTPFSPRIGVCRAETIIDRRPQNFQDRLHCLQLAGIEIRPRHVIQLRNIGVENSDHVRAVAIRERVGIVVVLGHQKILGRRGPDITRPQHRPRHDAHGVVPAKPADDFAGRWKPPGKVQEISTIMIVELQRIVVVIQHAEINIPIGPNGRRSRAIIRQPRPMLRIWCTGVFWINQRHVAHWIQGCWIQWHHVPVVAVAHGHIYFSPIGT